jgi:inhibitor of cysteine peptidase
MKTKSILILLILALISLSSCIVTSRLINVEISCEDFNDNPQSIRNDFQAEIGDKITVKLCSNPTTGFQWQYTMTPDDIVAEEDYDFEEPEGDLTGAPGMEVWTFEAVENGTTEIYMEYSQPWQGGLKAEWTYTMTVTVE